jgi:hypothetical protein
MRRESKDPARPARRGRADEMNDEALEFVRAVDDFKRKHGKPFPTWTEVLGILKGLGYRKVAPPPESPED